MKNLHRFIINYPHNFIEECYGNGWLAEHLQTKFNSLYDKYGAMGVIPAFICELDSGNEQRLYDYIDSLYGEKFARTCTATGNGMNSGYVINDGEEHYSTEELALSRVKELGYESLEDAFDDDACYWTEWESEND